MSPSDLDAAAPLFAEASRIALITHKRPDGDALGSLLGLGWALEAAGKQALHLSADGCPASLRFLPGWGKIKKEWDGTPDLLIALDTAELARLGRLGESLPRPVDLNLDHHVTNSRFGALNLIDPDVSSTAEIVLLGLDPWGLPLTQETATCLLAGLVNDTLGFRTSSTTPATLEAALCLMRAGAPLPEILRRSLHSRSFAAVRLWALGLGRLEREGRLIHTSLSLDDKQAAGYRGRDDADLITVLSTVEDADVAVVLVEQTPELTKVSWRANPGLDVSRVAAGFGGGGHAAAAGAEVAGTLEEVRERVVSATREHLAGLRHVIRDS